MRDDFYPVRKLKLPLGNYAIFGSSPLVIRKLKKPRDFDLIVDSFLWNKLLKNPQWSLQENRYLQSNNIEIYQDWPSVKTNVEILIKNAEIIQSLPFVQLQYVQEYKNFLNRKKDQNDLKILEKYLQNNN